MSVIEIPIPKALHDFNAPGSIEQMTQETAQTFFAVSMMENRIGAALEPDESMPGYAEMLHPVTQAMPYVILASRIPEHVKVSFTVKAFLSSIITNPGAAVMWAYTLTRMWDDIVRTKGADAVLDMTELSLVFHSGFPTEETMHCAWDAQKGYTNDVPVDNILDVSAVWVQRVDGLPKSVEVNVPDRA